ncbi:hypothetical protein M422DRAFT_248609 [Sphaerobolus stellatus SS14]|nr:hypothetical protein M422DRAFT_248609 [Sphaerobolus stellatus SS14]
MGLGSTVSVLNSTLGALSSAIQAWIVLLSDIAVIAITTYYAWSDGRLLKELYRSNTKTLTRLFIRQGVIRFVVIFIWVVEISLTDKLLNPLIGGVDTPLEDAMSSILVCRFMLDLRRYNDSEPKPPSLSLKDFLPISNQPPSSCHSSWTFHGYLGRVNELIMSEFGDVPTSYSDDDLTTTPPTSLHSMKFSHESLR